MKKEDLKAGYVLVYEDGEKRVLAPIMYQGEETLAMFWGINEGVCQQIYDFDPFVESKTDVVEVWGISDTPSQSMTTDLDYRKLLWKKEKPIKVTGDERVVLANLPSDWTFIARDEDGRLFAYKEKPSLIGNGVYRGFGYKNLADVTKLKFDCIKPLTCHKISDLL